MEKNIRENFGFSLTEFLDMPRDYIRTLIELADSENQRRANALNVATNNLTNEKNSK